MIRWVRAHTTLQEDPVQLLAPEMEKLKMQQDPRRQQAAEMLQVPKQWQRSLRAASPRQGRLQVPKLCLVQDRGTRGGGGGQQTETGIGLPCRGRLDIYLVVMEGSGEEEGRRQRHRERE